MSNLFNYSTESDVDAPAAEDQFDIDTVIEVMTGNEDIGEADARSEAVERALVSLDQVDLVRASVEDIRQKEGTLSPGIESIATLAMENISESMGFPQGSMEFGLESAEDPGVFRKIWRGIVNVIRMIAEKIANFFNGFRDQKRMVLGAIDKMSEKVSDMTDKADADKTFRDPLLGAKYSTHSVSGNIGKTEVTAMIGTVGVNSAHLKILATGVAAIDPQGMIDVKDKSGFLTKIKSLASPIGKKLFSSDKIGALAKKDYLSKGPNVIRAIVLTEGKVSVNDTPKKVEKELFTVLNKKELTDLVKSLRVAATEFYSQADVVKTAAGRIKDITKSMDKLSDGIDSEVQAEVRLRASNLNTLIKTNGSIGKDSTALIQAVMKTINGSIKQHS